MSRKANVSHRYFQLKSGYKVTDTVLNYIERRESDHCRKCNSRSRIDVFHIMFNWMTWRVKCAILCREYEIKVRPWASTVRQLLRSRKSTLPLLEFLATTRVGRELRVQEQEE